ncbi:unnamed protein product [Allacma fusca]|uniref:RING-type domain-containing protein n=1 Tax=Allacma fusca TaxID=39272 RepID=A0A8J2PHE1_9HEXA|nr:unnamed protein product [Allacma fusca]
MLGWFPVSGIVLSDKILDNNSEKTGSDRNIFDGCEHKSPNSSPAVLNNPFWPYYNRNCVSDAEYCSSSSNTVNKRWEVSTEPTGAGFPVDPLSLGKQLWTAVLSRPNSYDGTLDLSASTHKSCYLIETEFGNLSFLNENISWELMRMSEVLGCLLVFFAALVMFLLSTETLLKLYSYLMSILTLYIAYVINPICVPWSTFSIIPVLCNLGIRAVLVGLYLITRNWSGCHPRFHPGYKFMHTSLLDSMLVALVFSCGLIKFQPIVYIGLVLLFQPSLWGCFPKAYAFLRDSWNETRRVQNEYGLSHLIQVECGRLKVNTVFRFFWILRAFYDAFYRCCDESLTHILRYVMSHGTETFTGIVGLTVTVSVVCHSIGEFLLWLLYWGTNSETDANRFGSISTVLFFILSLQTGLTSLDPEKRLDRLLKNVVLLGTALFHALHQMVAPLLHAFRTFHGLQIRAATISIAFLSISIYSTVYLLRFSTVSTWSLAVLALAIEFKIKIIISLVISVVVYLSQLVQYPELLQRMSCFFRKILPTGLTRVVDKLSDQLSHEDMVFYLKSFANVAEFLTGWKIYSQRKTASMKIMSLADASDDQLETRKDDVCAICYEEMESAKVTLCGHLFHAVCLRKWLYVQNTCPLCHELLYGEDVLEDLNRAQQARAVEEDDEDDIFDNYAAYNANPNNLPTSIPPSTQIENSTGGHTGETGPSSPSSSVSSISPSMSESQSSRLNLSVANDTILNDIV